MVPSLFSHSFLKTVRSIDDLRVIQKAPTVSDWGMCVYRVVWRMLRKARKVAAYHHDTGDSHQHSEKFPR